jgi:hypothetical protein
LYNNPKRWNFWCRISFSYSSSTAGVMWLDDCYILFNSGPSVRDDRNSFLFLYNSRLCDAGVFSFWGLSASDNCGWNDNRFPVSLYTFCNRPGEGGVSI